MQNFKKEKTAIEKQLNVTPITVNEEGMIMGGFSQVSSIDDASSVEAWINWRCSNTNCGKQACEQPAKVRESKASIS